ncbi:hypothetical protein D3C78_833840 [compost metagenome]
MTAGQQQAEFVQGTGGGGQCGRGGQRQGARAGGDQHRQDDPERPRRVQLPPEQADGRSGDQGEQQEPLRGAVGDFRQPRFFRLGPLQQADDGRQARVLAQGLDFDGQRAFHVQGPGGYRVARTARLGQVFTGQQRLIDTRLTADDTPVGRHDMPGLNQYAITQLQLTEQDPLALARRAQAQAGSGQQVDQLCSSGGRALTGAAFQVAACEQEQGEHAHGIEIQLAAAGDRGPDPGAIGQADGQ